MGRGLLAFAGGLATGVGAGMVEKGKQAREDRIRERMMAREDTQRAEDRAYAVADREDTQAFQSGERAAGQEFTRSENAANRDFNRSEREAGQQFTAGENAANREFTAAQNDRNRKPVEVVDEEGNLVYADPVDAIGQRAPAKSGDGKSRYYVVPTARGQLMVDKISGMAVQIGTDAQGNLVRMGEPFDPMLDDDGMPTSYHAVSHVSSIPSEGLGEGEQSSRTGPMSQEISPLMTPSADAGVQYDVTKAKEKAKIDAEAPERERKAKRTMDSLSRTTDTVVTTIDRVLEDLDGWTAGAPGSVISHIPGTSAYDISKRLDTIKANIGFDKLQEMRDNSPTGGALGNVTERELALLQSVNNSIEQGQSVEELRSNLMRIRDNLNAVRADRIEAYQLEYGGSENDDPSASGSASGREQGSIRPGASKQKIVGPDGEERDLSEVIEEARKRGIID